MGPRSSSISGSVPSSVIHLGSKLLLLGRWLPAWLIWIICLRLLADNNLLCCTYMHECMHACMLTYIHNVYIYIHIHIQIYMYKYIIYIHIYIHIHIHIHIPIPIPIPTPKTYTYTYTYTYKYTHVYTYTCVYITHTYIHTHVHTGLICDMQSSRPLSDSIDLLRASRTCLNANV